MNDQTQPASTTPTGAASALTDVLGVLRPHELEVYGYLDGLRVLEFTQKLGKSWWRPMDVGGFDGSHHSRTLAKLVKLGLAERRKRGSLAGIRSSWEYPGFVIQQLGNARCAGFPQ